MRKSIHNGLRLLTAVGLLTSCLSFPADAAEYYVTFPDNGYYCIVPEANPNYAIDLAGGGTQNGNYFHLFELNYSPAQIFELRREDGDWYTIRHAASGKVLNVACGVSQNDARLWIYDMDYTAACYYRFADYGNGSYLIQNQIDPQRIIDLDNAICTNGSIVHLWDVHDGLSARWRLIPAPAPNSGSNAYTAYVRTSNPANRLNLRSAPSTSASILGKLTYGQAVTVLENTNGWARVQVNGQTGYVSAQYLAAETPAQDSASPISERLNSMINGSYGNGTYQAGTCYSGPYASEQCKGFAKQVHINLFGYNIGSTRGKPNNYQISIDGSKTSLVGSLTNLSGQSDDALRSLFGSARPGDFIQLRRSHGGSHSMIFLSADGGSVTVYEANVDGHNTIQTATYSYATFRSKNAAVSVYTANDYRLH